MVSVIIPNYNHAKFLKKRIESVLNQEYENYELIILDDHSTDDSKFVILEYKDNPKISKIIFNEINSGSLFSQWQKGIELATGKYIWIAESDDYADSKFLSTLIPLLENNPNAGIAYSDSQFVVDNKLTPLTFSKVRNDRFKTKKWEKPYTKNGREEIKENLMWECTINNASATLFRKKALLNANCFDIKFNYIGDWYAYLKICNTYDIIYVNKPYNFYRQHNNNASPAILKDHLFVKEFFNLFNYILTSMDYLNKKDIIKSFLVKTPHTLIKNWNSTRLKIYKDIIKKQPKLFFILLYYNATRPFIKKTKDNVE